MNKATRKSLILQTAVAMCTKNNKLSTKELKLEMRNRFPNEIWNKYDNGKGVTDLFHELVREGIFMSVHDNGTYQTYAHAGMRIADKKGAPYIPDVDEVGMNVNGHLTNVSTNTNVTQLGNALQKMTNMKSAVLRTVNKLLTLNASITSLEVIKQLRKDESTFYWTQATVNQLMTDLVTAGTLIKTNNGVYDSYSYANKAPVRKLKTKTAPAARRKTAMKKIATPKFTTVTVPTKLVNAVNALINPVSVTKKATVKKAAPKTVKNQYTKITKKKALDLMQNSKGQFFTAVFIKKSDNTRRIMNCQYLTNQGAITGNMVKVTDAALRKVDPNNCIRNVNLNTLETLSIKGTKYSVK